MSAFNLDPTGMFIKAPYTILLASGVLLMAGSSLQMLSPSNVRYGDSRSVLA